MGEGALLFTMTLLFLTSNSLALFTVMGYTGVERSSCDGIGLEIKGRGGRVRLSVFWKVPDDC